MDKRTVKDCNKSIEEILAAVPGLPAEGVIGVIAPAGQRALDLEKLNHWLRSHGYTSRLFPGIYEQNGYLAGSDEARLQDLHDAFADKTVDAIICLRGGYGSMRLLDRIDFELIRDNPKPFIGYSDITALQLAITRHSGFVTFHGPMIFELVQPASPLTETSLLSMLRGQLTAGSFFPHPAAHPLITIEPGVARGRLMGGNLSLICATLGTPYEIDADDIILFIEDVNEPLYKVDRLLTQMRLAGKLDNLRGVLIGDFAGLETNTLMALFKQELGPLKIPVLAGWRGGHCDPNLTLPIGAMVRLDSHNQTLMLEQPVINPTNC